MNNRYRAYIKQGKTFLHIIIRGLNERAPHYYAPLATIKAKDQEDARRKVLAAIAKGRDIQSDL